MILARDAAITCVVVGIALGLVPGVADRSLSSAMAQETADSVDLNGEWQFEYEVVQVTHGGPGVRADFLEGAECFDGQVRPFFLAGELSGTSLTGRMMVCSRSPELVEACGISSMYETTFEATVEPGRIAGTRVAQGLATEEEDGRYTSCVPDSRYDGTYSFEGSRLCADAEREAQELLARLDALAAESNEIADQLSAMSLPAWFEEGYAGPNADMGARWREIEQEMLRLVEQINATQVPAEKAALQEQLEALGREANAIEDVMNPMNLTNWTQDDYVGPNAELAARWHALETEIYDDVLPRLQEAERRLAECRGDTCPSASEAQELLARLDALAAESNEIADQLSAMSLPAWFEEGYAGP
ncbi:MAG: hypothetical protein ACREK2_08175, partial [Gemmatimonadota bacterium]